ncbi:MAG: L-2-hydroxyglutarate oxidase [Saprospiraceae bacterium]|nr:L-2-hydroxyglutarate oxidase [Saprospiraceae bacterium]
MKLKKVLIIGGGIVGLATAYQLLDVYKDYEVVILEKEASICYHQTGHNSGVIHSGIYYKPGSLRAVNCQKGYRMLIEFCQKHNINHEICGKLIVATNEYELSGLKSIFERGLANQLDGIKLLKKDELRDIEPYVSGVQGIFVPQTGIIDYRKVGQKYLELAEKQGAKIYLNQKVLRIKKTGNEIIVTTNQEEFNCDYIINCAGLYSDKVAGLSNSQVDVQILPFRGEYYKVKEQKRYLVKNLIYPVPDPNFPFLGVHFTRMINGELEAGPNAVLAFKREGYKKFDFSFPEFIETVSYSGFYNLVRKYWRQGLIEYKRSFSKKMFAQSLQALVPEISETDLIPAGSGVRASACTQDGSIVDDFLIYENDKIVNVCNAPSPAATASLSIGLTIANRIKQIS